MPPEQILSTFPPAGSQGDWRERLPQIVLKRRTLPWERNPDPAHEQPQTRRPGSRSSCWPRVRVSSAPMSTSRSA